jgi:6-phosphogluconolactonase
MTLVEYPDREMMMMNLANRIAGELNSQLIRDDFATLAVPGGTTPGPVFDDLCAATLDWARVRVLLTDERWVPGDSPRSNTRLIRERLLVDRAAGARYVPLYDDGAERPEDAIETLGARVAEVLPLTVLLLGMGEDMHIASLFPGAPGLAEALDAGAPPLVAVRPEGQEPRVSLSGPALRGAMYTHIVLTGDDKRAALERARAEKDVLSAPVQAVLGEATVHWAQ